MAAAIKEKCSVDGSVSKPSGTREERTASEYSCTQCSLGRFLTRARSVSASLLPVSLQRAGCAAGVSCCANYWCSSSARQLRLLRASILLHRDLHSAEQLQPTARLP